MLHHFLNNVIYIIHLFVHTLDQDVIVHSYLVVWERRPVEIKKNKTLKNTNTCFVQI